MERYERYKDSGAEWIGEIPEGWETKKIKHKCYVKARIGWKGLKSSEFLTSGYSYLITGTDFKNDKIDWNNCYHIDKDRYEEDPYIQLRNEDLLITKDGTIGKLAVVSRKIWKLHWQRANGKWLRYESRKPTTNLSDLVQEIDDDYYGCFFG